MIRQTFESALQLARSFEEAMMPVLCRDGEGRFSFHPQRMRKRNKERIVHLFLTHKFLDPNSR
jgi:hypothetical protein